MLALPCLAACGGAHRSGRMATTFAPPATGLTGAPPKHLHPPEPGAPHH